MSKTEYASSPCQWHETGELEGTGQPRSLEPPADVAHWRNTIREQKLAERLAIGVARRAEMAAAIARHLEDALGDVTGLTVSFYWPIRGEPDLRPLMVRISEKQGTCALPVVVERGRALVFRAWAPGDRLERGFWNIPVPAAGAEIEPDVVVAPLVAFDGACYRLGYGGGYFDRTLARIGGRVRVIGVGYSSARIATIHPQPHDVPMHIIVTEQGLFER